MTRTEWEWLIERWTDDPRNDDAEIVDIDHAETIEEAIVYSMCDPVPLVTHGIMQDCYGEWVSLCARRATFDRDGENPDYQYHYIHEDPDLTKAPKKIQQQLQATRATFR